jgi:hypothetical protein
VPVVSPPSSRAKSDAARKSKGRPKGKASESGSASSRANKDEPFSIVYFQRHRDEDPDRPMPGHVFLESVPPTVAADFDAVLDAVAKAPPHKFAGGGKWEAMHGDMSGLYEVRVDGPARRHYRLFCVLDATAKDRGRMLVVLDGDSKPFRTEMPEKVYKRVRKHRDEYFKRMPRRD